MIAQGKMAVRPLKAYFELVGSSGIIGYKPKVEKLFGLPTRLTAGGMSCDLIDADITEHSDNDHTKHVQANQQLGIIGSSLEHQVLEQLFAQHGEQGFSAVKAIQLANEQGQKIYTITKDNYQTIIPQLQLAPKAIADIQAAAQAGLRVTTHQKRISINGYTGEGYIILNERGDGAYMINGGLYGAFYAIAGGLGLLDSLLNKKPGRPLGPPAMISSMKKTTRALGIFTLFVQIALLAIDTKKLYSEAQTGEEKTKIILNAIHMLSLTVVSYIATYYAIEIITIPGASPILVAIMAMLIAIAIAYITSEPWYTARLYYRGREAFDV